LLGTDISDGDLTPLINLPKLRKVVLRRHRSTRTAAATDRSRPGTQGTATAPALDQEAAPLFSSSEAKDLRARWDAIQVGYVDEPRRAVEQADKLVAGTMKRLAEIFAQERSKLEAQWDQSEKVSTEDLRLGLRRYRSFFSRFTVTLVPSVWAADSHFGGDALSSGVVHNQR